MNQQKQNGNIVAIVTMIFLFAMISFVTNLAAPMGVVLKSQFGLGSSAGMLGNFMNFFAYLFFGIASGNLLNKKGYKFTALTAVAIGIVGIGIQYLSGRMSGLEGQIFSLPISFFIYLAGAFVAGISVCMLNTVVNPMLNSLGGGGNKGGQLLQIGGSFNSLAATITPMFVGILIGEASKAHITDVFPVMYIAMGVFAAVFVILNIVKIPELRLDEQKNEVKSAGKDKHSAWSFRHFVLGAIGIFGYVGIEVGIPGTLLFFLADANGGAGLDPSTAAATAGSVAGTYWFLMMIGRFIGGSIGGKVSSKTMLSVASGIGILFVLVAIFAPLSAKISMPAFTGSNFIIASVPISALFLVLCGLCTSIMWGGIFNLAVEGLGKYLEKASGIFMMMVVGGGVLPLLQNAVVDWTDKNYMISYIVPLLGLAYLLYYALIGSKNVNKDIPVK
ncbi:MAG: MFS transporter [Dysgonamonadaceae bacterium]|jgi:FHS family L-fucose permease-like MFS transporter|nr:MFS transporter [Dysgonamonadaceae bacterium]